MEIYLKRINIFWTFSACFSYAVCLYAENTYVDLVSYKFNGITINVYKNTELKELYKLYVNELKRH